MAFFDSNQYQQKYQQDPLEAYKYGYESLNAVPEDQRDNSWNKQYARKNQEITGYLGAKGMDSPSWYQTQNNSSQTTPTQNTQNTQPTQTTQPTAGSQTTSGSQTTTPSGAWASNPTTTSQTSTNRQAIDTQWGNYFDRYQPGQEIDWADGKLRRTADGAVYTAANGQTIAFNKDTPYEAIYNNPNAEGIRKAWDEAYPGLFATDTPIASAKLNNAQSIYTPDKVDTTAAQDFMVGVDPSQTVEGRMEGLLSNESKYMQAARKNAERTANSRGLLNSAMAAGAGEAEAIKAALPIAQQDAQTYANLLGTAQEGGIQSTLSSQESGQDLIKQAQQYEHMAQLYEQQGDIESALSAQQHAQTLTQQAEAAQTQGEWDWQLGLQQRETDRINTDAQAKWDQLDLDKRINLELTQIDSNMRQALADDIAGIQKLYMEQYTNVMRDPELDAGSRDAAKQSLERMVRGMTNNAAETYGITLNWA